MTARVPALPPGGRRRHVGIAAPADITNALKSALRAYVDVAVKGAAFKDDTG